MFNPINIHSEPPIPYPSIKYNLRPLSQPSLVNVKFTWCHCWNPYPVQLTWPQLQEGRPLLLHSPGKLTSQILVGCHSHSKNRFKMFFFYFYSKKNNIWRLLSITTVCNIIVGLIYKYEQLLSLNLSTNIKKSCMALYFRQFSTYIKIKLTKLV